MKVYIVVFEGTRGTVIESVFFTKIEAEKYCEDLEKEYHYGYRVIEREVEGYDYNK